ncbi:MAG TPA: DUF4363 family protein [Clostridiaceae bacterium]|jgi:adenine-specific DNA methylase|nr:DUF4363 family protein [Clostridiaceae bacterium]
MQTTKVLISLAVIALIIGGTGLYSYFKIETSSKVLAADIEEIETCLFDSDFSNAENRLEEFKEKWAKIRECWSVITDHFEIDNIDTAIFKADRMIKARDRSASLEEIASLLHLIRHLPETESLNIKNVF